ncbi:hypothetical protein K110096F8_14540 [Dielma fastidiosa]
MKKKLMTPLGTEPAKLVSIFKNPFDADVMILDKVSLKFISKFCTVSHISGCTSPNVDSREANAAVNDGSN